MLTPPIPRYLPVRGHRTCYAAVLPRGRRAARREPVLLVHGFLSSHQSLAPLAARLGRHRPVYALDLPGYGDSEAPPDAPFDRPFFARAVLAFADALRVDRFALVGHSMGGGVAQEVARLAPDRVTRLFLVSSVGPEVPMPARFALLPVVGAALFALFFVALRLVTSIRSARPVRCAFGVALATVRGTLRSLRELGDVVGRLAVPTTLIWGARDRLLPLRVAGRLASLLPRARLELLAAVGHFPPTEAPRELAAIVLRSLARVR